MAKRTQLNQVKQRQKRRRAVMPFVWGAAIAAALWAVGLPGIVAVLGGAAGGLVAKKVGDPESWQRFQREYPDSIKGKEES